MAGVEKRSFDSPDESRTPDKTRAAVVNMGGTTAARLTLESGWSWAECIKPVVGGVSCQLSHLGVVQSGTMRITHDDGTEVEIGPDERTRSNPATRWRLSVTSRSTTSTWWP